MSILEKWARECDNAMQIARSRVTKEVEQKVRGQRKLPIGFDISADQQKTQQKEVRGHRHTRPYELAIALSYGSSTGTAWLGR